MRSVGILGLGTYLPEKIRTNHDWPSEVVERWTSRARARATREAASPAPAAGDQGGAALAAQAAAAERLDPFRGGRERRVIDPNMSSADMEARAARDALAAAQVEPKDIDLLFTHSAVPDALTTNTACTLHEMLGIKRSCLSLQVEGVCNSFLLQLGLAEQMIAGGRARYALLVQSSAISRLLDYDQPLSVSFGDGATAIVVGQVKADYGILGIAHRTDGSLQNTLVSGAPGQRWHEAARIRFYWDNAEATHRMFAQTADMAKDVVGAALAEAGLSPKDVSFYASHQGTAWLQSVTKAHIGLDHARSVDVFPWSGGLFGATLPLVLATGVQSAPIVDGDVVAMFAGGSGVTWSGAVLRWGGK